MKQDIRFLQQRVSNVEITDYKVIKKANIDFSEGLNIITRRAKSSNAFGKTTILDYLIENSGQEMMPMGERSLLQIDSFLGFYETVLMDNILMTLDQEKLIKTLEKLANSKKQVICVITQLGDELLSKLKDRECV